MRAFDWYATPYIGIWVSFVRQTNDGQSEGIRFVFSRLTFANSQKPTSLGVPAAQLGIISIKLLLLVKI
jgi:hypothetical protein